MKLKTIIYIFTIFFIPLFSGCNKSDEFKPEKGDLLFQDLDCGPLCDSIETVTKGVDGARFSHVAIVSDVNDNETLLIEALPKYVTFTKLSDFLKRSKDKNNRPKVLVGRLTGKYKPLINDAIKNARQLIGKKYDDAFILNNDKYYCSELIYEIFPGKQIFELNKMTFKDPATGKFLIVWQKYFKDLNLKIPEGKPGLNPGSISRSRNIRIIHAYGCPDSYQKCNN